uniref:RNB domain-containing protein n=1 Tax=viral metagenome TaxID=1070528 RepID=A0A6C0LFJ3_9ZZZZ
MTQYKVHIEDRSYTKWKFLHATSLEEIDLPDIHPATSKMLTGDTFIMEKDRPVILHSTIRNQIPAVLILKDQKTYGRAKLATGKQGKLLYKCAPDDMRLPTFLVPYEMKHVGFSKVFHNQYVTINYVEWLDKHPTGQISQLIGPVDVLDNFYEYQLYCKSLNTSIQKFTRDASKALLHVSHDSFIDTICKKHPEIEDRTSWYIFSIDPPKSLDFDDAFSIKHLENSDGEKLLSIYIANVSIWLDALKLWDSFSRRISTIYLPDRKRPMLPTILSDCLCSLQSGSTRFAFVMDITLNANAEIQDIKYVNCKIRVSKNFCYEEDSLLKDKTYITLLETGKLLSKKYKYFNGVSKSHDLVSYLMIFMNYHTAKELFKINSGIFRMAILKHDITVPDHLPEDVQNFMKIWNSAAGHYIDASKIVKGGTINHDLLNVDAYIHITSPIRRIVDLLNIIKFQQVFGLITLSREAGEFYNRWLSELDYINTTMRSIRRIQNDCSLLNYCVETPGIMEKEYVGYAFDKIVRNDGLYQYIIYLPELKLTSRVTIRDDFDNFASKKYKLYLFHDEEKFKKKIRLQLL